MSAMLYLLPCGALEQRVLVDVVAVQPGDVARIDAALHGLQPVALLDALGDEALLRRHHREFPLRQRRRVLRRAHIGPQDAAALDQRIGFELDLLGEAAFLWLRRHLDALPSEVELPAVIGAAQSAFLVAAEPKRDAAMGTKLVDQPVAALAVAERHEPLGQQLDAHRRAVVCRQVLRPAAPASSSGGTSSPIGVPGPVRVMNSFCCALSMRILLIVPTSYVRHQDGR